jgi:DNA-binding XRE family transcriptional regulator
LPRLLQPKEIGGGGQSIHWERLDEDLSLQGLLDGFRAPAPEPASARATAALLKAARMQAGLTQAELARKIKLSQTMVSIAERGLAPILRHHVDHVLKACGLPRDWRPQGRVPRALGQ